MSDIDKWFADKVGARKMKNGGWISEEARKASSQKFSISDSACREIIREKFKINTQHRESVKRAPVYCFSNSYQLDGSGKTIEEAECNCLQAIYEARNDLQP